MQIARKRNFLNDSVPYVELQYIQSNGSQYLNTGIVLNSTTYNQLRQQITCSKLNSSGFSTDGVGTQSCCWFTGTNSSTIYYGSGYANVATGYSVTLDKPYVFDIDFPNNSYTVTDYSTGSQIMKLTSLTKKSQQKEYTLWICGYNGDLGKHSTKVYGAKYWKSNVLILDLIPVKNPDEVVCMYDLVSKTFFHNQGSGSFIVGPVKNNIVRQYYSRFNYAVNSYEEAA